MKAAAATPFRLIQVSDSHLSETHAYFIENWREFVRLMEAEPPDLIVHTGDVSFNGPSAPGDLAFARKELDRLPGRWLAIAGNHDIGEAPSHSRLKQPLNESRLSAWWDNIGPQWWMEDVGSWRLIGLDTALFASDLPEEDEQRRFLKEALASRGKRPVMVFVHMPPFMFDADDEAFTTSSIPHPARRAFLDTCRDGGVKVIACGHLHVYRRLKHQGMEIVWAPPTAMVSIERQWKRWRRFPRPGYIAWTFQGSKVTHELIEPALMIAQDTSKWTDVHGTTTTMPPRRLATG